MKMLFGFFVVLQVFFFNLGLYAENGAPSPARREQGFGSMLIMIAIAIIFFYFIMWKPERKRRKALETKKSSLRKGDYVTAMGILGTVARVKEQTVILKMYDGAKVEFLKAAISDVRHTSDEPEEEETAD